MSTQRLSRKTTVSSCSPLGLAPGLTAAAVDQHVGKQILKRRMVLGLSLQQLAGLIGVSYQQAHKYEQGLNRITCGRLYQISQALEVPVAWFFDCLTGDTPLLEASPRIRLSLELVRNFAAISNEKHKEALTHMARVLAGRSEQNVVVTATANSLLCASHPGSSDGASIAAGWDANRRLVDGNSPPWPAASAPHSTIVSGSPAAYRSE